MGGYSGVGWPGERPESDDPEEPEEPELEDSLPELEPELDDPPPGPTGIMGVGQTTISFVVVTVRVEMWYSTVRKVE